MPDYEAVVEGRTRNVELTKVGQNRFTAKIGEKSRKIELEGERIDLERAFALKIDGETYKVRMDKIGQEKVVSVKVEGTAFNVEIRSAPRRQTTMDFEPVVAIQTRKPAQAKQVANEGAVTAPMTGKVIAVKVKNGDRVKANQTLCVIEAMKMENEISAPRAGMIQTVNVSEGQGVNEGDTLFIIT